MQIKTFVTKEFPENVYAVVLNDGVFLIDPGEFTNELNSFVVEHSNEIKYIFLTHNHFDHIRGVDNVKRICPDAKIVIHSKDAEGLYNPLKSLAAYFGFEQEKIYADLTCEDGDCFYVGSTKIKVLHTPGHSLGSVCYFVDDVIFSGDTLFEGSCGRTDFPDGNSEELEKSLKKLKDLSSEFTVYPGHGNSTKLSDEQNYNPYMRNL